MTGVPDIYTAHGFAAYAARTRSQATISSLDRSDYETLDSGARAAYDERRRGAHAHPPTVDHPHFHRVRRRVERTLDRNSRSLTALSKPGMVIGDLTRVGKSTLALEVAVRHHLRMLGDDRWSPAERTDHVPVMLTHASVGQTLIGLVDQMINFLDGAFPGSSTLAAKEHALFQQMRRCRVSLVVIDELHQMRAVDSHGRTLLSLLVTLANRVPVTIVAFGITVRRPDLFVAGKRFTTHEVEQIEERFDVVDLEPYSPSRKRDQQYFRLLLDQVANQYHLLDDAPRPGRLDAHAEALHDVTQGRVGSLRRVLLECADHAMDTGQEAFTDEIMRHGIDRETRRLRSKMARMDL